MPVSSSEVRSRYPAARMCSPALLCSGFLALHQRLKLPWPQFSSSLGWGQEQYLTHRDVVPKLCASAPWGAAANSQGCCGLFLIFKETQPYWTTARYHDNYELKIGDNFNITSHFLPSDGLCLQSWDFGIWECQRQAIRVAVFTMIPRFDLQDPTGAHFPFISHCGFLGMEYKQYFLLSIYVYYFSK